MAYDVEQLLINEANRIGPDIYRKTLNTSPWLKLVKKDVWPDEMGDSIKVLTYERSLPTNALAWSRVSIDPLASSDGSYDNGAKVAGANGVPSTGFGNNAVNPSSGSASPNPQLPNASQIQFAQTLRSYNLTQVALESPKLSVNDLRFSLKRKEQLSNIFDILQENTSYAWQDRFRDEFVRIAQNKINAVLDNSGQLVANSGDGSSFSTTAPVSTLTQGMLDRVYMKLIRDGAGNNPLDRENARPVFGAILSSEASRNLISANADIRQDYRWSSKVNELLTPLGIERSYAGFFHMVDDWGPRYNLATDNSGNHTWVRVYPYTQVATTQGYKWDINPDYENATYEDTIIFHQDVFVNLVPKPITAAGSNVTFDAVSYMGDFKWKNIITPDTNPDGTIGYFRAILSSGSKPIRPEWGYVIRHLRASTPLILQSVVNGSAVISPITVNQI
jgi:hypothetical protein